MFAAGLRVRCEASVISGSGLMGADMIQPVAPLLLALYEPDIAQNAGAMFRTCACLGVDAAMIEPAGFRVGDSRFRRAVMDYLNAVSIEVHDFVGKVRSLARGSATQTGGPDDEG